MHDSLTDVGTIAPHVAIIGTGKTARDFGVFLWSEGYRVTWLTRTPNRREGVEQTLLRELARWTDSDRSAPGSKRWCCQVLGDGLLPEVDIVFESGVEDREIKRDAFLQVAQSLHDKTVLLSNSSSLLPREIHPEVIGLHLFFPIALTRFAELVVPEDSRQDVVRRAEAFAKNLGIALWRQHSGNAFALNRLLLPSMAEIFRGLRLGYTTSKLDDASRSPLFPLGLIRMMDSIGYDTLNSAVHTFIARMSQEEASSFQPLKTGLQTLVSMGVLGRKNRVTLLTSSPRVERSLSQKTAASDKTAFQCVLINTCYRFAETEDVKMADLSRALSAVFGSEMAPEEALATLGRAAVRDRLLALYTETGISYFKPSHRLERTTE